MSESTPLVSPLPSSSRSRQSTSAFSRLANLALSSSSDSQSSPNSTTQHPPRAAFDALESIANLDNQGQRKRHGSTDSRLSGEVGQSQGGGNNRIYPRGNWQPRNHNARDSSESRSRERISESNTSSGYLASTSGSGFIVDSPGSRGGSYWGGVSSSYTAGMSGFSQQGGGGGHYFQPGAGTSGFSFETPGAGGAGTSYWDASFRSSITGSPSLFGGGVGGGGIQSRLTSINLNQNQNQNQQGNHQAASSSDESKLSIIQPPWGGGELARGSTSPSRPRAQSPNWQLSLRRSESPMGGGRKLKENSRKLRYSIQQPGVTAANRDKGLVGIAKPPKDSNSGNGELGRVVVAGKTCKFSLSHFPLS